jgi:hypothetical protein
MGSGWIDAANAIQILGRMLEYSAQCRRSRAGKRKAEKRGLTFSLVMPTIFWFWSRFGDRNRSNSPFLCAVERVVLIFERVRRTSAVGKLWR